MRHFLLVTHDNPMPDSQVIEVLGRNRLTDELLRAGLEVALPVRDKGIDMIVYSDTGENFAARPIRMKAASDESFSIDRKYIGFPHLLLAYVWHIHVRNDAVTYALTYAQAIAIADRMGYTQTESWQRGYYVCTRVSQGLRQLLRPYCMTPQKWREIMDQYSCSYNQACAGYCADHLAQAAEIPAHTPPQAAHNPA